MQNILITGSAGFIGYHLTKSLLRDGFKVFGLDNINDYYDPKLKIKRLKDLKDYSQYKGCESNYVFSEINIADDNKLFAFFEKNQINIVINLAAQAGVRYSIENPKAYIDSNLVGFANVLEACKRNKVEHLIYASSSSIYGMNSSQPFNVSDNTDFPISLYAATKKSNELLAYSYSHLFDLPCTGLRFFTVYGPYGRPDMAYYKFTKAIDNGDTIDVYNNGNMKRDFTYIDDIIEGIRRIIPKPPSPINSSVTTSRAPYKIYNIGNNNPVTLKRFIKTLENALSKKAKKNFLPMQPGDVPVTYANIDDLKKDFNFQPSTSIEKGIMKFVIWYKENS